MQIFFIIWYYRQMYIWSLIQQYEITNNNNIPKADQQKY